MSGELGIGVVVAVVGAGGTLVTLGLVAVLTTVLLLLFGAAGQLGIFATLLLAIAFGFPLRDSVAIGIIGAMDGPTAIFVSTKYAPHLLGAVSVAAYSYMSLVPLVQPPIMRALTTKEERRRVMPTTKSVEASRRARVIFPIAITIG